MNNKSRANGEKKPSTTTKPNEFGGVYFSSSIKIFDPNTQQVILQKRGDA